MLSVTIPKNVELSVANGYLKVVGPYGTLIKKIGSLEIGTHESRLYVLNAGDQTNNFLSLLRGYLVGVSKGYRRKLRLIGVGYRASIVGNKLSLKVGFSHELTYEVPADVTITCSKAKGTIILIRGKELQRVNQVASEIRRLRQPDSYKGKGIHYDRETLRLKKGKREGA
jgi:large subunit ribosomal protein L6